MKMAKTEAVDLKKRKRKEKEVAMFGNYRNYYGYRIKEGMEEDPRLKVFKKEWFEGKECLDIGCNQGLITIKIAKNFSCRSIVGIDIDACLIETAYRNLRRICNKSIASREVSKASESKISDKANGVLEQSGPLHDKTDDSLKSLSERVSFRKENFVERLYGQYSEMYDTILCLSVTKWVHLNWGDDGLIDLFTNIWRLLRPGGILLLEPQPWKSYHSNRQVSEVASRHYNNIVFGPCYFQEMLLDKIGFKTVEIVANSLQGSVTGFNRSIFLFRK